MESTVDMNAQAERESFWAWFARHAEQIPASLWAFDIGLQIIAIYLQNSIR